MKIRAFNLVPGAVIVAKPGEQPLIVRDVRRRVVNESVFLMVYSRKFARTDMLSLNYCDEVELIGLTPNYEMPFGETDYGTKAGDAWAKSTVEG